MDKIAHEVDKRRADRSRVVLVEAEQAGKENS